MFVARNGILLAAVTQISQAILAELGTLRASWYSVPIVSIRSRGYTLTRRAIRPGLILGRLVSLGRELAVAGLISMTIQDDIVAIVNLFGHVLVVFVALQRSASLRLVHGPKADAIQRELRS